MSDKEIIDLYRDGQEDRALEEIVAAYSERLYWHVRRFTCSHEDADDLLQDILIKVWKSLATFRSDSQLYTWIYRVATNECLNFIRKNRVKASLRAETLETILDRQVDDDPSFDGDSLQREVQKAVNSLPAKQKLVFVLRYFDEMPYEQMSQVLGTSVGSLKASYHHAYYKVKEYLEKRF